MNSDMNIDQILEDVVVGALKQLRDIDEPVIRQRWKDSDGYETDDRVAILLGGLSRDHAIIMETLNGMSLA